MTDEDVFEPHSSLANLDFVKGHIENSEKTKLDWIICFFFFLLFFLSGTNWKPLLQRRISNTQEPSLVFFFFNVNCQRCCSPKNEKKNQGKKKSENKDFYQSGYLLTAKKETPKSLSSTDPLLLLFWRSKFSNGRAERERERETELFTILLLSDCGSGSGNGNGRGEYVTGGFCVFDGPILNEWNRVKK